MQVLQQSVDRELNMYSDLKERTNKVAQIMMLSLSSQPVDHEENGRFKLRSTEIGKILSQMYRCAIYCKQTPNARGGLRSDWF